MSTYVVTFWHDGSLSEVFAEPCDSCRCAASLRGGCFPEHWLRLATPFFAAPCDILRISTPAAACADVLFGTEPPAERSARGVDGGGV
jgi:hypothetical protein